MIWKEAAYFKVLSKRFLEGTEEIHENFQVW
jgi:hypothetical protein